MMDTIFSASQTVGEIAAMMPKATEVFKQYSIDFCCGGNRKLSEAIKEKNLNESEVLNKLGDAWSESRTIRENGRNFGDMSSDELISIIESMHHAYLKKVLPELGGLTLKIMNVHGRKHFALFSVHKLFSTLRTELEMHLVKEEEILFPQIREYCEKADSHGLDTISQIIADIEKEHEAAGDILKELRKITEDYKVPDDGCSTYAEAFRRMEELEADLFQHIHLENNILFKDLFG